jgi:hypothetical protein
MTSASEPPCFLREAENEIAPAAYLVEPSGIQLDRRFVFLELAGERFEPVVRRIVGLLKLGQGRIDLLNRRQLSRQRRELGEDALLFSVQRRGNAGGERAQLLRMFEPASFVLEANVFTIGELGVADFLHDVPQIIGATLGFGSAFGELGDLADDRGKLVVRLSDFGCLFRGAGKGIEDAPLRLGVEQGLRFVLPVQVDELSSDLGE